MRANTRRVIMPVVVDGLLLAAFAATMLTIGGAALDAAAIASLFFGGTIVAIAGSVIVIWTVGDAYPSHHVMAILLGSLATSLVLLFGCMTTGTLAAKVFLVWSGVVLAAGAWTLRSAPEAGHRDGLDVLAIAAIAILVVARCHDAASTLPSIQATGIAPVWSDYSIHGTEIAQFGDPHVQTLSSFLLAGQPLVFYHYASYMLPAAAAGVVSLPPWGVATSLLLPYGILLMSLAVYVFARTRLGTVAAMIVPAALLLIPDASAYGLRNGFFGFHWMLFTAPGSGYGLSAAFTALTLVEIWRARQRTACLWLGLFVMVSAFQFRAHIFLLLAPAMAAALLCETTFVRRHARIVALAAALTVIIVVICLGTWQSARDAWLRFSVPRQFLEVVHTGMSPTAYDGAYKAIDGRYGPLVGTTLGLLALIPAALGAFAIALPIAGAAAVRRTGWRSLDTFPMWCVTAWLASCCWRQQPTSATTPSFSSGHSCWSTRRLSSGRSCSSSAHCRPPAHQPEGCASHSLRRWSPGSRSPRWPSGTRIRRGLALVGACNISTRFSSDESSTQRRSSERTQRWATRLPSFRLTRRPGWTTMRRGWRHWRECRPT